jgi:hypothetical protein
MSQAMSAAHALAQQVLAYETAHGTPTELPGQALVRACEKLRVLFCRFVGVVGFRSLLARALTMAQRDAPLLAPVEVTADGALAGFGEGVQGQDPATAAAGGLALLTRFFGLLHTFVGEALTQRLLADCWPGVPLGTTPPGMQENDR